MRGLLLIGLAVVIGCGERGGEGSGTPAGGLTVEEARAAGVILGSCVPDDGITDAIEEFWRPSAYADAPLDPVDLARCLAREGGGCLALEECAGIVADLGGPCTSACVGSVLTQCDDSLRFRWDCAQLGLVCDPMTVDCVPRGTLPPMMCDVETFTSTCEDGRPVDCYDEIYRGPVCADLGLECAIDEFGASCRGPLGACPSEPTGNTYGISCMGTMLESCVNDGRALQDCATVGPGFSCQSLDGTFFCGLASECDPFGSREINCTGTSVEFCNMGRLDSVDCRSLGFTGCMQPFGCVPTGFTL